MLHRIYTEINNAESFAFDFVAEKVLLETSQRIRPTRIRKVIEISGEITKEALGMLKQCVASERGETVTVEKEKRTAKGNTVTVMQKYGRTDRKSQLQY